MRLPERHRTMSGIMKLDDRNFVELAALLTAVGLLIFSVSVFSLYIAVIFEYIDPKAIDAWLLK